MADCLELFLHEVIHSVHSVVCRKSELVVCRMTKSLTEKFNSCISSGKTTEMLMVSGEESDSHFVRRILILLLFCFSCCSLRRINFPTQILILFTSPSRFMKRLYFSIKTLPSAFTYVLFISLYSFTTVPH